MSTRIRPVRRRDALSLAALRLQLDRGLGHPTRPGFLDAYADALLAEWERYVGWIVEEEDGRPVGFVLALRIVKLPTLLREGRAEWWYVQGLFVVPDRRDQGWGGRLVDTMTDAGREARVRRILANATDEGGALLTAHGFGSADDGLREWRPDRQAGEPA